MERSLKLKKKTLDNLIFSTYCGDMDLFKAKMSALSYMDDYGLLDQCWHFNFQNKKRALGTCSYFKKSILLSSWYVKLNEESDVEDTILHEIAHAISFIR